MEKCLFGRAEVHLPNLLTEDLDIFLEVVSTSTWQREISDGHRHNLMTLLPSFGPNDGQEKIRTLQKVFTGENFKFGNPLHNFHKRLREGQFSPEVAKYSAMIKKAKYKEYENQQKLYVSKLLKEVLVNRQRLLDAVTSLPPGENAKVEWWSSWDGESPRPNKCLELTVCKKYRSVIKEINEECGRADTSSDEEDLFTECSRNPSYSAALLHVEDMVPSVFGTHDPRPKLANGGALGRPGKRSVSPVSMNEDTYLSMLREHKKRRLHAHDDPEMDTQDVSLDDVISRTHGRSAIKPGKPGKVMGKKKTRKAKQDGSLPALWSPGVAPDESAMDSADLKEEADEDLDLMQMYVNKQTYGQHACFFSLLRDLVCEEQDARITTFKIEQKVCDWQKSECAAKNTWFVSQKNWADVTLSALKFLSGHSIGLEVENLVPLLDYRERAQLWKWIGWGNDLDIQLRPLYDRWLENRENEVDEQQREGMATPPPRSFTDYVVRPAEDEDKEVFQEQETMRFENPHQAFTYYMHGYESVVAPVKGVFDKPDNDSSLKARDHTLLVKERPPYVTILTLVRDAAARLPNGSGTRADIVELLKYSQFLARDAAASLVHSVVSGALDRLHYEKDPCVKYSSARKIWIYLHRNRSEEDFNKLHRAAGKVVKAKLALTKPKAPKTTVMKKPKDTLSAAQSAESSLSQTCEPHKQAGQHASPQIVTVNPSSSSASPREAHVLEVSAAPSMSGLDILSSVAHAKISGNPHSTVANNPPMMTKIVSTPSGRRRVSIARPSPETTTSLLASHLISSTQAPLLTTQNKPQPVQCSSKPVAFSLLQSSTVSKLLESRGANVQRQTQSKTVVLGSKQDFAGKPMMAALKEDGGQPMAQDMTSVSVGHTVTQVASPSTAGSKPVLARLFSQSGGQQVITLPGGQKAVVSSAVRQVPSAVSVPDTPLVHTAAQSSGKPGKPVILQRVSTSHVTRDSRALPSCPVTPSTPQIAVLQKSGLKSESVVLTKAGTPPSAGKTVQYVAPSANTVQRVQAVGKPATVGGKPIIIGGKPLSLVSGKPVAIAGGKPVAFTGAKSIHIGGTPVHLGGKPVQMGGKAVQIGGKPVQLSGKPIQIGGKPVHIGEKPVQIGGKPLHLGEKPVQIGGKPVQIGEKPVQIGGKPVQIGMLPQAKASQSSAQIQSSVIVSHQQPSPVKSVSLQASQSASLPSSQAVTLSQSVVNQLIQTGQLKAQPGTTLKAVSGSALQQVLSGATLTGQQVKVQGQPAPATFTKAVSSATPVSEGARVVPSGGMLGAQRIVLQSPQASQHVMAGKPAVQSSVGVKAGQSIQLVRTVVSQAGKPGTTILLTQPGKTGTSPAISAGQIGQQSVQTLMSQSSTAKGRGAPVYARIITPGTQSGIRLVRTQAPQGQVKMIQGQQISQSQMRAAQGQGQIRNLQGVNVVQTMRSPTAPSTRPPSS